MKPTSKQLSDLKAKIAEIQSKKGLTSAEIGRMAGVHPSQVGRICAGQFKTFSHNVVQVCNVLDIGVPRIEPDSEGMAPEWAEVQSSIRQIWDETPEGARTIAKMLRAIAKLTGPSRRRATDNG